MGLFDTAEARLADLESRVATLEGATPVDPPPEPTILTQQMFPVSGTTYLNLVRELPAYDPNQHGIVGYGFANVNVHGYSAKNLGYGFKVGTGALTSDLLVEDYTARACQQPMLLANLHGGEFNRLDLEATKFDTNQWHGIYIERDVRDVAFHDLTIKGGSGYCLQLYYGSATVCTNLVFEDVILDARTGRYPLIISNGFSNITFRRCTLLMPTSSDGVCVRLYSPTNILIEDFTAEGGLALVGTITGGNPQATFRNGTYKGPALKQQTMANVVMDNVTRL